MLKDHTSKAARYHASGSWYGNYLAMMSTTRTKGLLQRLSLNLVNTSHCFIGSKETQKIIDVSGSQKE